MSMLALNARAHGHGRSLSGLAQSAARILALCSEQWALHKTRMDLARLDDRLLRDIGLDRHAVLLETAKPFWKR